MRWMRLRVDSMIVADLSVAVVERQSSIHNV